MKKWHQKNNYKLFPAVAKARIEEGFTAAVVPFWALQDEKQNYLTRERVQR